jgi:carbon-monoxide dehydrogenase small subunit
MVIAATELIADNPDPTEAEIREHMSGNVCRCTGYHFIVDSVLAAAKSMRGEPA